MEYGLTYNDYFLWNDALWKYYFENEQNLDKVLLYADEEIIKKIGEENESIRTIVEDLESPDYLNFFYDSILLKDRSQVNDFFYCGKYRNGEDKRTIGKEFLSEESLRYVIYVYSGEPQTTAIIQFARALSSINNPNYIHKCPCLSFVIFLIIAYGKTRNYFGINSILKERSGLKNATILPELFSPLFKSVEEWSKVNKIPRFYANQIRGEQEFVGVLRYHLVLNRSELNELQDALYNNNIDWDESELPYKNLVNNYVLPNITKKEIKDALRKNENYAFFYNLFHSFSPENYIPSKNLPKKQRGHFFLLFDREDKTFLLKTDVRAYDNDSEKDLILKNDVVKIACDGERECGLYGAIYLTGGIDLEKYSSITYDDNSLKIIPVKRDWLFFIMSGKYFQQVITPVENEGCLIITKKGEDEVHNALGQDSIKNYTEELKQIFGEGYNVFYVERWKTNIIFADNEENDEQGNEQLPVGLKLTNGILNPSFKRCYLPEGLPVIQSEQEISIEDIAIYEDENQECPSSCVGKSQINENSVRLILNTATNKYQEFHIVVSGDEIGVVRVKGSNTSNGENSIWYDSWGCASVIKDEDAFLCDNSITYEIPDVDDIDNDQSYPINTQNSLIPLLKSYAYARKESHRSYLLDRDISKIINYVSSVEQWNVDKDELSYVKYNLINLGVLSMATDDCGERRFEVNNARLVPVDKDEHLLYGAYTFSQLEKIKHSSDVANSNTKHVPGIHSDLLFVKLKNSDIESVSGIPVEKELLVDILLKKAQKMDITKFKEIFMNSSEPVDGKQEGCKFGKPSKDDLFSYIQEDGQKYALYHRKDNTFQQIPTSLQKLYVCRINNKPLMMWNEDTSKLSFTWNMGVPHLVERALCMLNKNVGDRIKVFGMNKCIDSPLYGTITSFKLSNENKAKVYSILSSDEMNTSSGILTYKEYDGPISLFHMVKQKEKDFGLYHEFVLMNDEKVAFVVNYDHGEASAFGCDGDEIKEVVTNNDVNEIITDCILGKLPTWGKNLKGKMVERAEDIRMKYQELKIINWR